MMMPFPNLLMHIAAVAKRRMSTNQQTITIPRQHLEYYRQLIKKLMFVVHPDFFENYKTMQLVNSQNLRFLQSVSQSGGQPIALPADAKTLVFYIKPDVDEPRKVKVSLQRLHESIAEILDAQGVQLPVKPSDLHTSSAFAASYPRRESNIESMRLALLQFLDSLVDRRELIAWKQQRIEQLHGVTLRLLQLTGLKAVDFENCWSAANNCLLLQRLIHALEAPADRLLVGRELLKGMTLVIHNDPMYMEHVDFMESKVFLDCSAHEISVEWMNLIITLSRIKTQPLPSAEEMAILQGKWEEYLSALLTSGNQSVKVAVRRGYTCSQRGYFHFLQQAKRYSAALSAHHVEVVKPRDLDNPNALPVEVVIEEHHGTKLLPDGNYRLDANCDIPSALEMMKATAAESLQCRQAAIKTATEISNLQAMLVERLQLVSLCAAVGTTEEQYLAALHSLCSYLDGRRQGNSGVLKHFNGLHLRIGQYAGIADDGACVLPWDLQLT